ncbi:MAG: xanthine dehydrogenase family protein subunit M [Betaproteobacteria bacterium]|nr:xanthine dehydrogenase family protein subunit M [Betaproteobacteria bacterium]
MKPPKFAYHAPAALEEAIQLLERYQGNARVLAGGQSLVPLLNFRLLAPEALVDLRKVPGLADIRVSQDRIHIGAMTRQRAAEVSPAVRQHLPIMKEALGWVGHLPTRTRGTIGGSIAHADPSAELPMVLLALDGEVFVRGPSGARTIAADDLFDSVFTTTLAPGEIIAEVRIPPMDAHAGFAVEEYARRKGDFAIVAIAAIVEGNAERCTRARLVAAGAGGRPVRLRACEEMLQQRGLDAQTVEAASRKAAESVTPTADPVASADFRRHLTGVLAKRALGRAIKLLEVPSHG